MSLDATSGTGSSMSSTEEMKESKSEATTNQSTESNLLKDEIGEDTTQLIRIQNLISTDPLVGWPGK